MASKKTGQELRRFFIELQEGKNLSRYYADRDRYIGRRKRRKTRNKSDRSTSVGYLGAEAQRLLSSADLREIEDSIRLVTGSGSATPLTVVCPPI